MIPLIWTAEKGFGPFSAGDCGLPRGQLNRIMLIGAASGVVGKGWQTRRGSEGSHLQPTSARLGDHFMRPSCGSVGAGREGRRHNYHRLQCPQL